MALTPQQMTQARQIIASARYKSAKSGAKQAMLSAVAPPIVSGQIKTSHKIGAGKRVLAQFQAQEVTEKVATANAAFTADPTNPQKANAVMAATASATNMLNRQAQLRDTAGAVTLTTADANALQATTVDSMPTVMEAQPVVQEGLRTGALQAPDSGWADYLAPVIQAGIAGAFTLGAGAIAGTALGAAGTVGTGTTSGLMTVGQAASVAAGAGAGTGAAIGGAGGLAGSLVSGAMQGQTGKDLLATGATGALTGALAGGVQGLQDAPIPTAAPTPTPTTAPSPASVGLQDVTGGFTPEQLAASTGIPITGVNAASISGLSPSVQQAMGFLPTAAETVGTLSAPSIIGGAAKDIVQQGTAELPTASAFETATTGTPAQAAAIDTTALGGLQMPTGTQNLLQGLTGAAIGGGLQAALQPKLNLMEPTRVAQGDLEAQILATTEPRLRRELQLQLAQRNARAGARGGLTSGEIFRGGLQTQLGQESIAQNALQARIAATNEMLRRQQMENAFAQNVNLARKGQTAADIGRVQNIFSGAGLGAAQATAPTGQQDLFGGLVGAGADFLGGLF